MGGGGRVIWVCFRVRKLKQHSELARQARYLGGKAGPPPGTLGDAPLDDLGLCHQHVHEVTPIHEVKQEVQVVLVLEAGVLADAEGVGCVACDGLLTEDVLWALHHRRLAHALQGIRPVCRLLCRRPVCG